MKTGKKLVLLNRKGLAQFQNALFGLQIDGQIQG